MTTVVLRLLTESIAVGVVGLAPDLGLGLAPYLAPDLVLYLVLEGIDLDGAIPIIVHVVHSVALAVVDPPLVPCQCKLWHLLVCNHSIRSNTDSFQTRLSPDHLLREIWPWVPNNSVDNS